MEADIINLAKNWIKSETGNLPEIGVFYCETRDIFQARYDRMLVEMINKGIDETMSYMISAMVGEIGFNSFDHNLGKWPDVPGVYFAYDLKDKNVTIVLSDRGQGVLASLKRVKTDLKNDKDALTVAFTRKISGRAPENRGNGLKFVKAGIKSQKMHLDFYSGIARAGLNEGMEFYNEDEKINGCLAILSS